MHILPSLYNIMSCAFQIENVNVSLAAEFDNV